MSVAGSAIALARVGLDQTADDVAFNELALLARGLAKRSSGEPSTPARARACACGSITNAKGTLLTGVREAVDRGIRLDVAHGWHFSLAMARMVLEQGILPYCISSDQHRDYQIPGRPTPSNNSLQLVMSKMMALGLTLEQVITMTTTNPAEVLKISDHSGRLEEGRAADISVIAVMDGHWNYRDLQDNHVAGKQRIAPVITVKKGRIFENNPVLLPDLESIQDFEPIPGRSH